MDDLLQQGIAAAKAGQRERARDLLMRLVEQDEDIALAWLWLSGVIDSLDDRQVCLENALSIEPDNAMALKGLQVLEQQRVDQLMRDGIAAAKAGQRERAYELLRRAVAHNEENAPAWLWLSGVVDNLEERQICLENVLSLDPDNAAARKGLAQVQQQQEEQQPAPVLAPESPMVARTRIPITPAAAILRDDFADHPPWQEEQQPSPTLAPESPMVARTQIPITPAAAILRDDFADHQPPALELAIEPPAPAVMDGFGDEYLCPYCASSTEPEDRKCKACGSNLWLRFRKLKKRSRWLWLAIFFQIITAMQSAVPAMVFAILMFLKDGPSGSELITTFVRTSGMSRFSSASLLPIGFVVTMSIFLFSLALLISLYLRWKPAYYIYVANGALKLFGAAMVVILSFNPSSKAGILSMIGGGLFCAGINALLAVLSLWLVFQMQDDFVHNEIRILFRTDPSAVGGSMLLVRGHEYAKRKMWALSALHLRRAIGLMPGQVDGRGSLILTYLKLKKYDAAAQTLEEARRIDPDDPRLDELQVLLDDARAAGKSN